MTDFNLAPLPPPAYTAPGWSPTPPARRSKAGRNLAIAVALGITVGLSAWGVHAYDNRNETGEKLNVSLTQKDISKWALPAVGVNIVKCPSVTLSQGLQFTCTLSGSKYDYAPTPVYVTVTNAHQGLITWSGNPPND